MRFSVVLVDDEPWILEGMRVLLPWAEYGLTIDRAYTDPLAAYEAIVAHPPDVVFADIRMPEMSGIDLLRAVKARGLNPVFYMVSGYAEFDYVQEALRLGAFGYLTKPVELDSIRLTFAELRKKLISERVSQGLAALDALSSEETARQLIDLADENADGYLAAFVDGDPDDARDWAERMVKGCVWRAYAVAHDRALLILHADERAADTLRRGREPHTGSMAGISGHGIRTEELPELVREAYLAHGQRYVDAKAHFCAFERGQMERMQSLGADIRKVVEDTQALAELLESVPERFRKHGMQVVHAEQLWNFCAAVFDPPIRTHTAEELLAQFASLDEQCAHLAELVRTRTRTELRDSAKRLMNRQLLDMLREVESNYHRPLSLRDLSARYFLNLSYASELFHRATGMTFTEYVTQLRMSKAMRLMETDMELQEIARQVGYEDYFYFSKVFKKIHGTSPTQYRART